MPDAGATGPLGAVDTRLADRIYEAPFAPDLWPAILDDLALKVKIGEMCHPPRRLLGLV